jgi:hypothetical protein
MHAVELRRLVMLVDVADRNEVDARRPPVDAKFASKRSVSVARSWARVSCVLPKKAAIELSTKRRKPGFRFARC